MTEEASLEDTRARLKKRLAANEYRSVAGWIFEAIARLVSKIPGSKDKVSYWYATILVALINLLIGLSVALILGEDFSPGAILISIWGAAVGALVLAANQMMLNMFQATFSGKPIESIESLEDLQDLEKWLTRHFKPFGPTLFSLIFGPALGFYITFAWSQNNDETFYFGLLVIAILASIEAMIAVYYLYPFYLILPSRLSGYEFNLFNLNPSSSEVTKRLSDLFTGIMYITLAYVVFITLGFAYFNFLTFGLALFIAIPVWAPSVALYAGCQRNLAKIIVNSKWRTLNELQKNIEDLRTNESIPSDRTLDHLEKLMNYHDRIKNTPNSALNFRAGLSFLSSLILPIAALVLANLENVIDLFR